MNPQTLETIRKATARLLAWLKQLFDLTANWVTQLSWWRFILFAVITMIIGGLLQDSLFSPDDQPVIVAPKKDYHNHGHMKPRNFSDGDTDIHIDNNGIHISPAKPEAPAAPPAPPAAPVMPGADQDGGEKAASDDGASASAAAESGINNKAGRPDVHIKLPPEISKEVGDAIDEAVQDETEQRIEGYRQKSSKWFMNFVTLLVVGLLGTKALMGGKKRAEAQAAAANAAAEREALQRQVTEAKMQMMQAQVEPHFLFNTLASVEHLIETDPPRASAMQRRLIQYLRAVLPQMRENAAITNLGREADMVSAYLDLLKMRMEDRLQVEFSVPDGLRSAAFPPMMLQSLVENAIKHGLEGKEEGGTLSVAAEIAHNKLRVTVTDDGMGFGVVPSTSTGLGLQSIRERLTLLHGKNAQLVITPNSPSGVCATIEVPYQLAK